MKYQPNAGYKSNDIVMTPERLAKALVDHFSPAGKVLEPCKGTGNILKFLPPDAAWCEIDEGRNFFEYTEPVDWIFTNPPWSQIKDFLLHSMKIAKNVCLLMTLNHLCTSSRVNAIRNAGFGIKEIVMFKEPKEFPHVGFQLGMVYFKKKYKGRIKITHIDY